jgi:hypothetical protein
MTLRLQVFILPGDIVQFCPLRRRSTVIIFLVILVRLRRHRETDIRDAHEVEGCGSSTLPDGV